MDNKKLQAMLWGAFYGDAYALGAHWVYDVKEIEDSSLDFSTCNNPLTSYHNDKKAGDFTHYGDQMLWLLESIAIEKEFSLVSFGSRWVEYMNHYVGYIDGASNHTLSKLSESKNYLACGSSSADLSVVGRMFPILYAYHDNFLQMQESVKLHTIFTHMNKDLVDASAFFSELTLLVLNGSNIDDAIERCANNFGDNVARWVLLAQKSLHLETTQAISDLGQSCSVKGGFSATLHLLLKHGDDFDRALKENVLAGGDSAARGLIVGAILGIKFSDKVNQANYKELLTHKNSIEKLIKMIDEHH